MSLIKRLFSLGNILNLLLVFIPVAFVLRFAFHTEGIYLFAVSALAIIPLAGMMGRATEHLANRLGEGIGGLLNATFGNAAELIIGLIALKSGHYNVVKASITGSIIGNILLVFGISALAGGLRFPSQRFNPTAASMGSTMLALSAIALIIPAIFHQIVHGTAPVAEHELSTEIAVVLLITYTLSLVFTLKTHKHLYMGGATEHESKESTSDGETWSRSKSIIVLLICTVMIALMSEFLVGAIDSAAKSIGMSEIFVGVILVAIVGNAAEHSTAVLMALKNKMDLTLNIAIGSSIQVALFVAPALVLLSYLLGPKPMDLLFSNLEVVAIALSVAITALIANDGESNWMEGVQLLAVYVILGIAFFVLPV